mgnify:CR=1 FL=1
MIGLNDQEITREFNKELGKSISKKDQELIDAFTQIILKNNDKINLNLRFNHTDTGEILRINDDGSYCVRINNFDATYGGGSYRLFALDDNEKYNEGDKVVIEVVNNDFSNKYIKSKAMKES